MVKRQQTDLRGGGGIDIDGVIKAETSTVGGSTKCEEKKLYVLILPDTDYYLSIKKP